ncbi:BAG domain-containing protein [Cercophora newfieldiana]|uniref:BAG domain-containing protein n=1 Tax=Cercophora newfieldiana TaxID=92897 RepID=A0AA39YKQ0_9PEZI|nr:BAG domain-containing protein [Cercophora newfieldiana]
MPSMASGQSVLASYGANLANVTSLLKLPASIQTYLDSALVHASGVTEYLESATGYSPTTLYSTAGAILLLATIPAVATRNTQNKKGKMSSRYGFSTRGGISPFGSSLGQGIPAVTDDDYSYITSEDLETIDAPRSYHPHRHEQEHFSHSAPGPASSWGHRKPADDVMLIKYKDITYPEHFPAYSIGDGKLEVNDVTERVKLIMNLSAREAKGLRLYYKGRQLKDPKAPIREYGVKNNSEVLVVFGEPIESSGESSEEIVVVDRNERDNYEPPRKSKKKNRRGRKPEERSPRESNSSFSLEVPVDTGKSRGVSRVRTQSPSSLSAISGASAAAAVPGGPVDKLNSIAAHFDAKLRPLCDRYINEPPSDTKKLEDDHRKISETVMQQVILKLDEVDTGGDDGARTMRRQLVRDVQGVLKRMDDVKASR